MCMYAGVCVCACVCVCVCIRAISWNVIFCLINYCIQKSNTKRKQIVSSKKESRTIFITKNDRIFSSYRYQDTGSYVNKTQTQI